jgi:hypothetical protein
MIRQQTYRRAENAGSGNNDQQGLHVDNPEFDQYRTPLIEELFMEVLSKNSLKVDVIHPNVVGHCLVVEKFHAVLCKVGFLSAD